MSTKCGWAVVEDGEIVDKGLIKATDDFRIIGLVDDFSFLTKANLIAKQVFALYSKYDPDYVYIEQTNSGSFRTTQKLLEFIHFAVLNQFDKTGFATKVKYVDTSAWRSLLKIHLSKEDKVNNKLVKQKKKRGKVTAKHLSVRWANKTFDLQLKQKDNDIAEALAVAMVGQLSEMEKARWTSTDLSKVFK